jgi:two-component system cell cycle sensor histidine kinase/response regulator CckA
VAVPEFFQRKRMQDDLRRSHEGLEARVRERTADLEAANEQLRAEIAERKAVEYRLRASEDRFALAFRLSPAPISISTLVEGRYVDVNDSFARLLGVQRESILGRSSTELGFWVDTAQRLELVQNLLTHGRVSDQEVKVRTVSGETREVLLSGEVIELAGQRCLLGICHDVTERLRAEEALRLGQKMESLGVLAGGVAHDFNNLLAVMLGHNSLALRKLPEDSPSRTHVEKAVEAAERAAGLTRQMLAYSGRGHFEIRSVDLNQLVRQNLNLLSAALPKQIELHAHLPDGLPLVAADPSQMQQVVMNLILNAAEAIGSGKGTVVVSTAERDVTEGDGLRQPTGEPLPGGLYVQLKVQDDGPGMDTATLARIFEPFFTTKATGRGLGLAAVQGIVRGHRGGLQAESAPGVGTTFSIYLPSSPDLPEQEPAPLAPAAAGIVLVVDDEPTVLEMIASVFEDAGIPWIAASDGEAAVRLFGQRRADIRLVLLDLSMPGLSGEDTFAALRRLNADVRIVLSSGYAEAEATLRFVGRGLAGFLQKPYRPEVLVETVRRALSQ